MSEATTRKVTQTVGIDLGDRYSHYEVLGADGETTAQGRFRTTSMDLEKTFGAYDPARMVIEVGTHAHEVDVPREGSRVHAT